MDNKEFKQLLNQNAIKEIDGGKTMLGTHIFIPVKRLSSSANRLNSSWIRAQYIILDNPQNSEEAKQYLNSWTNLPIYDNQYFIINIIPNGWQIYNSTGAYLGDENYIIELLSKGQNQKFENNETAVSSQYLRAMRTKPFLLLAGISGTGKSRIVKQMAFDSCPDNAELRSDPTSPGNYCLIEVKPNWHDSTELLGYESKIGGAHYQLTTFVKFLIKAMLHPNVPFFVCLDEMNLAPVEQYFAEFLSVLESRTKLVRS